MIPELQELLKKLPAGSAEIHVDEKGATLIAKTGSRHGLAAPITDSNLLQQADDLVKALLYDINRT